MTTHYRRSDKGALAYQRSRMKWRSGWTPEAAAEALERQAGMCKICARLIAGTEINKDHEHATKRPRGLLCRACNISLGYYEKWQRPAGLVIEPYEVYLGTIFTYEW